MIVLELHNMCTKKYMYQRALRLRYEIEIITSQLLEVLPIVRAPLWDDFVKDSSYRDMTTRLRDTIREDDPLELMGRPLFIQRYRSETLNKLKTYE